jgi:predicted metalloprotease with PDZ domain
MCAASFGAAQTIRLQADASNITGLVTHVHEDIPVSAGPFSLYYPQWMPGAHSPVGTISNLMELHFHVNGQEIPWVRDDVDAYEFHLKVPDGATELKADFDDVQQPGGSATATFARVSWFDNLLYPAGKASDDITFQASLKVPHSWSVGTALPIDHIDGDTYSYRPISLTRLVDDPIITGLHFNRVVLRDSPLQEMDLAADTDGEAKVPEATVDKMKRLIAEEFAYFGAHHYDDYHFLLTFSAYGGYTGLEHNESSEDGIGPNGASDSVELGYLVCHEFTHSWNGKYRRPKGLATANYQDPMAGELLWVYEGFTEFTGTMLTSRTGFWTENQLREAVAAIGALMGSEQGRNWRPVSDTAVAVHDFGRGGDWGAERRSGGDYYYESVLVWLNVDAEIRRLTDDKKSIDDYVKVFYGPPNTGPIIKPYIFDDVVNALNSIAPNDWATFLRSRVYDVDVNGPMEEIAASGWNLVYTDQPNERSEHQYHGGSKGLHFSLGIDINGDGDVSDAIFGMPAHSAGVHAGMKITKVNGKSFSMEALTDAVAAKQPFDLEASFDGLTSPIRILYTGGLRNPHLVRNESKPDYLSEAIRPHAH